VLGRHRRGVEPGHAVGHALLISFPC
jgi:hypothetical protein